MLVFLRKLMELKFYRPRSIDMMEAGRAPVGGHTLWMFFLSGRRVPNTKPLMSTNRVKPVCIKPLLEETNKD